MISFIENINVNSSLPQKSYNDKHTADEESQADEEDADGDADGDDGAGEDTCGTNNHQAL